MDDSREESRHIQDVNVSNADNSCMKYENVEAFGFQSKLYFDGCLGMTHQVMCVAECNMDNPYFSIVRLLLSH